VGGGRSRVRRDIEHADKAQPDLAGEANALATRRGERGSSAVEREIVQTHVFEEAESAADFLHHLGGNQFVVAFELQLAEEFGGFRDARLQISGRLRAGRSANSRTGGGDRDRAGLRV